MTLGDLWFVLIAVVWTGFFVLEGFDLGVGMLHRLLGRGDVERRLVVNTIGPFWDGNEVWLIVGGAAIFAAFPGWYATWFSAGYLALVLALVALIARGLSLEWRGKSDDPRWRSLWSWALTLGSLVIPLVLGIAIGDLLVGLPIDSSGEYTGGFIDLFTAYGVMLGVTLVVLCLLHGATFISLRTTDAIRARAHGLARPLAWVGLLLVVIMAAWTGAISQEDVTWVRWVGFVPVVGLLLGVLAMRRGRDGWSFVGTAVGIGGLIATVFANLFPAVMVSTTDAAYTLTVEGTASGDYALKVMTVVAVVLLPVVLGYQIWAFWVFRRRLTLPPLAVDAP